MIIFLATDYLTKKPYDAMLYDEQQRLISSVDVKFEWRVELDNPIN